jgi:hypothetical protein
LASGHTNQLTRQIGEHLVVAKLGRLGFLATPFAGNVPDFDLLIADEKGNSLPIQVKAINGPSWQFQVSSFLDIEIKSGIQHVRGKKKLANRDLLCIFVFLKPDEKDSFFIFQLKELQSFFHRTYKDGRRPNNPNSLHCAIWPKDLSKYKDNWKLIKKIFSRL